MAGRPRTRADVRAIPKPSPIQARASAVSLQNAGETVGMQRTVLVRPGASQHDLADDDNLEFLDRTLGVRVSATRTTRGTKHGRKTKRGRGGAEQGRRKRRRRQMPEELQHLMDDANQAYIDGRCGASAVVVLRLVGGVGCIACGVAGTHMYVICRPAEAIQLCQAVVAQSAKFSQPYLLLALIYEHQGDKKKALASCFAAVHIDTTDAALWKRVGTMSHDLGMLDEALDAFKRAHKLDPDDENAAADLAHLYTQKAQYEKVG